MPPRGSVSEPVELHVQDTGHGPPVVLLHGLGGDHTGWNEVSRHLAGAFRAIAPDLRGHGRSPYPERSTLSLEEMSGDVVRLLDRRELRSAHLVGLSAGAFLALRLARDHPARVRSLVLVNGAAYCDPHTREILESWMEEYRHSGKEAFVLRLAKDLFQREWMDAHLEYLDLMRARWNEPQIQVLGRWGEQLARFDLRGRLSPIQAPTLILQGMSDVVIDPSHGRFLRQSIRGAELKIYRETGHLMPLERPRETAEAVTGLVRAVEARPRPSPRAGEEEPSPP